MRVKGRMTTTFEIESVVEDEFRIKKNFNLLIFYFSI